MLVFTELSGLPWPLRMKLHRILDLTDLSGTNNLQSSRNLDASTV